LIVRIPKKVIFYSCLLANLASPIRATTFQKIEVIGLDGTPPISWSRILEAKPDLNRKEFRTVYKKIPISYPQEFKTFYKRIPDHEPQKFEPVYDKKFDEKSNINFKVFKDNLEKNLANSFNDVDELVIQSEKQTEKNNVLYAEGNVLVFYKGSFLKADSLIYDKSKKIISSKGDISLNLGNQLFEMAQFEYDFNQQKGYLSEVNGLLNTDVLINDLLSKLNNTDTKTIEQILDLKKDKVIHTPAKVNNWIFFAKRIDISGEKWKSPKAFFTNDLLSLKQVNLVINSLEAVSSKEELKFKSSLSYLVLDEKVSVPFWLGNRTFDKKEKRLILQNTWNLGYENVDKDGLYIGRRLKSIKLSDDFILDLEPQFLLQRSLKGYTKSFVRKGDARTANKVRSETSFEDYFGLNSRIRGKLSNWDLDIEKQIYSFDSEKFSRALRFKSNLSKEFSFLNSKWEKIFYGVFRDRVWNGSIGESEIYRGYGSKLEKQNTWEVNGISKSETISLGLGNFAGEDLNSKDLVDSFKGNIFYSLEQKIPISVDSPSSEFIDKSFEYIPEPIKKGFSINTKAHLLYSLYEKGNNQGYLGFGAGPEFIFGNFKKKFFDYTRISILPFYKLKTGESIFKFDQISEKLTLDVDFDQQLYGPLILKSSATFNLDSDSKEYGDFVNSKISLNWKKRSYEFGIFFQPHNQAGGVSFNLFGFR